MPSWFPMFGRFLGAAKPALKFAEKYQDATDWDPLQVFDMMGSKKGAG